MRSPLVWFLVGGKATDPGSSASPADDPSSASNAATGQAIKLAGVKDFDPFGDPPEENPDEAGNAIDGNQDTAWTTLTYRGRPTLGGLKPGVGLVVDLGSIQNIGSVRLDLDGSPSDVSLYAAPTNAGQPTSLDGLKKIAKKDAARRAAPAQAPVGGPRPLPRGVADLAPAGRRRVPGGDRRDHGPLVSTPELAGPATVTEDPSVGPGAPEDDRALLAAHVAGDPEAFGTLFGRHRDRLWAVALRTTGNPADAADALQDAMISAFSRAETFRGDARVTTWLHRIVVNACLDRIRRSRVRAVQALPDDLDEYAARGDVLAAAASAEPEAAAERSDLRRQLLAALDQLPPDQKAALVLVDMQGYPVEEAARILECPTGTVKSRCSRGRARLAALLPASRTHPRPTPGPPAAAEPIHRPDRPMTGAATAPTRPAPPPRR